MSAHSDKKITVAALPGAMTGLKKDRAKNRGHIFLIFSTDRWVPAQFVQDEVNMITVGYWW